MGIKSIIGPRDGRARVGTAFSAMSDTPGDSLKAAEAGGDEGFLIRHPIPVFALDLKALSGSTGDALGSAHQVGWRYVIEHGAELGVVDLPEGGEGGAEMLSGGDIGTKLVRSARKAERIAKDKFDYEPRILDLNLLGNSVFWLHCAEMPDHDFFVSLRGRPIELDRDSLLKRLKFAADRKLAALDNAGEEAGG